MMSSINKCNAGHYFIYNHCSSKITWKQWVFLHQSSYCMRSGINPRFMFLTTRCVTWSTCALKIVMLQYKHVALQMCSDLLLLLLTRVLSLVFSYGCHCNLCEVPEIMTSFSTSTIRGFIFAYQAIGGEMWFFPTDVKRLVLGWIVLPSTVVCPVQRRSALTHHIVIVNLKHPYGVMCCKQIKQFGLGWKHQTKR